jgi:hypothetical protein
MEQLTNLDEYRRTSASPRFGPRTLHGKPITMPDESLSHLLPSERVQRILGAEWTSIQFIADRADITDQQAREICAKLVMSGIAEKIAYINKSGRSLYRLRFRERTENKPESDLSTRQNMVYNNISNAPGFLGAA